MNIFVTIIVTILIFGLIIFIHELGHFLVAKASGIRVNEFALGMGPTLFHFGKGETKYALRLFPIGGFVSMEGEDDDSEDERAFFRKPVWKRILVVLAGAAMNLILGFIVLMIMISMQKQVLTTQISAFHDEQLSAQTGLKVGDEILKIDGARTRIDNDISFALSRAIDNKVDFTVRRNGTEIEVKDVQFPIVEQNGRKMINPDFYLQTAKKTPWQVIKQAGLKVGSIVKVVWISLSDLVTGRASLKDLSGPVGVATVVGDAVHQQTFKQSLYSTLNLLAFITINIGVFNLLPFPALDGGRFIFLIIEGIRRKPVKREIEGYVNMVGFALLMLLMVVVTFKDIWGLIF